MAEGVQRAQEHRPALLRDERNVRLVAPGRVGNRGGARVGVPDRRFVGVTRSAVIGLVGRGRRVGGGRGRRDVGDRGDVVPVDAVADPEDGRGRQQADGSGGDGSIEEDGCERHFSRLPELLSQRVAVAVYCKKTRNRIRSADGRG